MNQRRNHYRIEYPLSERPLCIYNNKKLPVIDISEGGAQIEYSLSPLPRIGNLIKAKIVFDNRATVDIEAKVTRISGIKVALIFSKGVDLQIIMNEQRYLLKKFGKLSN